ncbi:MAG: AAA family ATPase [Acidovorax sp.]|jgi:general secretion pathway protein A|uniref:ExeA family protein n=1 Tax=Acidovorax sp. TaxID=1872122 RepID=UPI00260243DE|nr:AAA family ATPase [Acidovorax sp.]MDH4425125.1 AAA family ATPase [Acidovorax sp.]
MYAPYFGLRHPPFSIAPDPRYLFMSERHREALAHLLYGLDAGGGFVLLTGEVGAGKTTVCRCFLEQIPSHCNVAYIFNPKLTVHELLRSVCDEFGVPHKPGASGVETVKDYIDPLNASLLAAHGAGRNTVLIIDEAQNLSADVLEQLRLLTNLETSERKLLQIILIGQPELRAMVASPALEQLAQRVIARFHLDALSLDETQQYIAHRMAVAGLQGPLPFSARAMRRVHALSRGIPRRINLLCDRALLGAYAAGVRGVTVAMVNRAAREVFDRPAAAAAASGARHLRERVPRWAVAGLGAVAGAVALALAGWAAGVWVPGGQRSADVPVLPVGAASGPTAAASGAAASAAASPASAASAVTAPKPADALAQFLRAQDTDDASAWLALASAWGASVPDRADPCTSLSRAGVRCYRNPRAGLNLVRQLDRPVLVTLYPADAPDAPVTAVLRHLDGNLATLEGAGQRVRVPVEDLAEVWRGDLATLWRAPDAMPDKGEITDTAAGTAWLDAQLASRAAGGAGPERRAATPAQRQASIHRFQLAQGVVPDGRPGPLTLMLLNRATGVNEPRLRTGG